MDSQITIRPATPEDAASIANVRINGWKAAYRGQIPDKFLDSLRVDLDVPTWKKQLEDPARDSEIVVAEMEGSGVVGFCIFGPQADEGKTDVGELRVIYAMPGFWGMGIGTKMISTAYDYFKQKGYKRATLWVLKTNEAAKGFYTCEGWKPDGKEKTDEKNGLVLYKEQYEKCFE